jgi:hypothetical protein
MLGVLELQELLTVKPEDAAHVLSPAALIMAALLMCPEPTRLDHRNQPSFFFCVRTLGAS